MEADLLKIKNLIKSNESGFKIFCCAGNRGDKIAKSFIDGIENNDLSETLNIFKSFFSEINEMGKKYKENLEKSKTQRETFLKNLPSKDEMKKMTKLELFELAEERQVYTSKSKNKDYIIEQIYNKTF